MDNTVLLDDATLEKVSLIEDINKCKVFLDKHNIDVEEFDTLYDKDLAELVFIQGELSKLVIFRTQVTQIGDLLRRLENRKDNGE